MLVISTDLTISDAEDDNLPTNETLSSRLFFLRYSIDFFYYKKDHPTYLTNQNGKRARSYIEYEDIDDHESHDEYENSSASIFPRTSNTIISNLNEINSRVL